MRVPLPADITGPITDRAAQLCREDIEGRGWRTSGAIQPFPDDGQVGLRTTVRYLMYQNKGIRPYLMHRAEGHILPLQCKQGDGPHVRLVRGVGTPGWVEIPHVGRTWRQHKWKHPGLQPKRFMESSISRAVKENKPAIQAALMKMIGGGPRS